MQKPPQRIVETALLVGVPGFEPGTPCSQSRCASRAALHPDDLILIFYFQESNFESGTLPIWDALAELRYTPMICLCKHVCSQLRCKGNSFFVSSKNQSIFFKELSILVFEFMTEISDFSTISPFYRLPKIYMTVC